MLLLLTAITGISLWISCRARLLRNIAPGKVQTPGDASLGYCQPGTLLGGQEGYRQERSSTLVYSCVRCWITSIGNNRRLSSVMLNLTTSCEPLEEGSI